MDQPFYSSSLNRVVRPETPCPICGVTGRVAAANEADGDADLPLRCANGHTITMVRMPIVPEEL
jgi:hypothetical protein